LHSDIIDGKILNPTRETKTFSLTQGGCTEGERRNIINLNSFCSGTTVFDNRSYEICTGNRWVARTEGIFNRNCEGRTTLEQQVCDGNISVSNFSRPVCITGGTCGRENFLERTPCLYGCRQGKCITLGPTITILSPKSEVIYRGTSILLNASSNQQIINWTYNLNGAGNVSFNNLNSYTFTRSLTGLKNGTNNLSVCGTNSNGTGCSFVAFQFNPQNNEASIFIDIVSPISQIYRSSNILVNISTNGTSAWYNWNGTNVSYSGPVYITFREGANILHAWANDSIGRTVYDSVTFSLDISRDNDRTHRKKKSKDDSRELDQELTNTISLINYTFPQQISLNTPKTPYIDYNNWLLLLLAIALGILIILLLLVLLIIARNGRNHRVN
jgi:hypothetical protein